MKMKLYMKLPAKALLPNPLPSVSSRHLLRTTLFCCPLLNILKVLVAQFQMGQTIHLVLLGKYESNETLAVRLQKQNETHAAHN